MKEAVCKKASTILLALLLFLLSLSPIINAQNRDKNKFDDQNLTTDYGGSLYYDLIIITPEEFEVALEPLVQHKFEVGITTKIVTLDEIYSDEDNLGRDEAEKIKYFIKFAIEEWQTEYVLLVGGKKGQFNTWYLPIRYVNMDNDYESCYISDLYFADIYDSEGNFSSWDSDGDSIFGEWYFEEVAEDKNIDLYPDVAVGRLPCRNKFEVKIVTKKIIDYERYTYGQSWFYNLAIFAGDTMPSLRLLIEDPSYEGEEYGNIVIDNMPDFDPDPHYTSDGTFNGLLDVVKAFNKGCGFAYFAGHGSPQLWGTYKPEDENQLIVGLTVQSVPLLSNIRKLPICVLSGCHCCQFDVSIFKIFQRIPRQRMEATFECLGWKLTRKAGGGSIATIGCTGLGYIKEDKQSFEGGGNELEVEFFKQHGTEKVKVLGDAWENAISWYIDTYPVDWNTQSVSDSWIDAQVVESWVLFGDPSLRIGGYKDSY